MAQADGSMWLARIDGYEFEDVEFNSSPRLLRIYSVDPNGARDTDHDRCRTLHIDVELPSWEIISNDFMNLRGYVSQVRRYPEGEGPVTEWLCDGGKYCRLGEPHPGSDAYLPPEDESFKTGVYEINLERYRYEH